MSRLVYHGTDAETARLAVETGILPRSMTGKSQWETESHPDHVYLTRLYAGYFGYKASKGGPIGIIEVDLDRLSPDNLYPDEDFVEQGLRALGKVSKSIAGDKYLRARTLAVRYQIERYKDCWAESLEALGNVAHRGVIPPSAITRVVIYDPLSNPVLTNMMLDPTITVLNSTLFGETYQRLTAWLMGDPVKPEELFWQYLAAAPEQQAKMEELTRKQGGIACIYREGSHANP